MTDDLPTILSFKSAHCAPCRALEPVLDSLAERYAGRIHVRVIDTNENMTEAARFGVMSVPTLIGVADGTVVAQQVGYAGPDRVEALFEATVTAK